MRLVIRPMAPRAASWTTDDPADDRQFVVKSWAASYRRSEYAGPIAMEDYGAVMSRTIGRIIDRPGARVIVAADGDATDHVADLFGWLAWSPRAVERTWDPQRRENVYTYVEGAGPSAKVYPLVWYCYVKAGYRGHGIARRLLEHAGLNPRATMFHCFKTKASASLCADRKLQDAIFRPLLGRFQERPHGTARPEADSDAA